MVGTLINNMTQCEDGTLHALTDEQVIETALAAPPEGACVTFPWLLDRPAECLDLHPSVLGYAAAVRLLQDGANTFHAGAPQRHVMAVRSDQGCFAVLWELSVPRLHTLGELEAAAVAAAAVAAVAAAPVALRVLLCLCLRHLLHLPLLHLPLMRTMLACSHESTPICIQLAELKCIVELCLTLGFVLA